MRPGRLSISYGAPRKLESVRKKREQIDSVRLEIDRLMRDRELRSHSRLKTVLIIGVGNGSRFESIPFSIPCPRSPVRTPK